MNAFHPRTLLLLREQLAIHTSRLDSARYDLSWMQHRNVSEERLTECQEVIDWRAAVVEDLAELIRLTEQANRDAAEDDRIAAELGADEAETPSPFEIAERTRAALGLTGSTAEEVSVVRVELVPAAALDEDQLAAPARGHRQDDGDADEDFEFAPMSAEDYDAEQAAFDAANVEITAKLTRERRIAAAQACEDSCGGSGVCAFGPHDPITTPTVTSTTGATE